MLRCPSCDSPISKAGVVCPRCGRVALAGPVATRAEVPTGPRQPVLEMPTDPDREARAETILANEPVRMPSVLSRPATQDRPRSSVGDSNPDPHAATRLDLALDQLIGQKVAGKYQIIELLAVGGMGKVYKARHLGLDRFVCVKMLRPALTSDPTTVGRFEREAKAASRLSHPNAIQVFDFGDDGRGGLYLAMEYVAGRDLRRVMMEEHPLGEARICHIMAQVLSALADAHGQQIIHRDLKPENIMLELRRGESDFVKVLDFGIAKILENDQPALTLADRICGTPLYMSPEQATGGQVDARSDLYAVGVILYQLATGVLPFFSQNTVEVLTKHVNEKPLPPRVVSPELGISPELEQIIVRSLAKEPAARFQSAEEFRQALLTVAEQCKRQKLAADASVASTEHRSVPRLTAPPLPRSLTEIPGSSPSLPRVAPPRSTPARPAAPPAPTNEFSAPPTPSPTVHVREQSDVRAVVPSTSTSDEIAKLRPQRNLHAFAIGGGVGLIVLLALLALRSGGEAPANTTETVAAASPAAAGTCPSGMRLVSAGTFAFGTPGDDMLRGPEEHSATNLQLGAYCIDQYEFPNRPGNKPSTAVTWKQADELCRDEKKRLCTEAEWERACKGPKSQRYAYDQAFDAGRCNTVTVAGKPRALDVAGAFASCATSEQVFDLAGNAAEWTSTPYDGKAGTFVVKGGTVQGAARETRCSARSALAPAKKDALVGVRCCADPS